MKNRSRTRKLKFLHTLFAMERDLIVGGQAVVDGTRDENFLKAPVKVIMPEEKKSGKAAQSAQSAGAIGSVIFALLFNILLFLAAPLLLTNLGFIAAGWADAPSIAAGAGWFD